MSRDSLLDFLEKAKAATMKQLRGKAPPGARLSAAEAAASAAEVYKPKTAWNSRDKSRRTVCVRTMASECQGQHEVWLTLWSKEQADVAAVEAAVSTSPAWEKREGLGERMYAHGPILLGFEEKGTATLIYQEKRKKPFSSGVYAELLVGLFKEVTALLGAGREGPSALIAALESAGVAVSGRTVSVALGAYQGSVAVVDDAGGKRLVLTIVGKGGLDAGLIHPLRKAVAAVGWRLERLGRDSLLIEREFASVPTAADIAEVIDHAAKCLGASAVLSPAGGHVPRLARPAVGQTGVAEAELDELDEEVVEGVVVEVAGEDGEGIVEGVVVEEAPLAEIIGALDGLRRAQTSGSSVEPSSRATGGATEGEAGEPAEGIGEGTITGVLEGILEEAAEEEGAPPEEVTGPSADEAAAPAGTSPAAPEVTPEADGTTADGTFADGMIEEEEVSFEELMGTSADEAAPPVPRLARPAVPAGPGTAGKPAVAHSEVAELLARVRELESQLAQTPQDPPLPGAAEAAPAAGGALPAGEARVPRLACPAVSGTASELAVAHPAVAEEPEEEVPEEEVPQTPFGKFRAVRRLGRDVLGVLYQAEHVKTGQVVALKVVDREHVEDPAFAERFVRDSWPAAKLKHPNLKRILAVGRAEGRVFYYASEFVEGRSVRSLLASGEGFDAPEARRVVRAVAEALRYAHGGGVFHGDIRPSQVILTTDGGVKLSDMGTSRGVRDCVQRLLQRLGWTFADALSNRKAIAAMEQLLRERRVVTNYLAPELVSPRARVDARSDVDELGATYYHMATGGPPLPGSSPERMLMGQAGEVRPAHAANPSVPEELSRVIMKMMDPVPENRLQSAEEVIAALDNLKP